jgi:Beta-lactamase
VVNRATGVAVTTDSLFQVGSITKVWTATMVMQLIEEGRLSLGTTVGRAERQTIAERGGGGAHAAAAGRHARLRRGRRGGGVRVAAQPLGRPDGHRA